jgi:hypothetical protein
MVNLIHLMSCHYFFLFSHPLRLRLSSLFSHWSWNLVYLMHIHPHPSHMYIKFISCDILNKRYHGGSVSN